MYILVFTRIGAMIFFIIGLLSGFCFCMAISINKQDISWSRFLFGIAGVVVVASGIAVILTHNPIVGGG